MEKLKRRRSALFRWIPHPPCLPPLFFDGFCCFEPCLLKGTSQIGFSWTNIILDLFQSASHLFNSLFWCSSVFLCLNLLWKCISHAVWMKVKEGEVRSLLFLWQLFFRVQLVTYLLAFSSSLDDGTSWALVELFSFVFECFWALPSNIPFGVLIWKLWTNLLASSEPLPSSKVPGFNLFYLFVGGFLRSCERFICPWNLWSPFPFPSSLSSPSLLFPLLLVSQTCWIKSFLTSNNPFLQVPPILLLRTEGLVYLRKCQMPLSLNEKSFWP